MVPISQVIEGMRPETQSSASCTVEDARDRLDGFPVTPGLSHDLAVPARHVRLIDVSKTDPRKPLPEGPTFVGLTLAHMHKDTAPRRICRVIAAYVPTRVTEPDKRDAQVE